ncbi:MAG: hypothetical protein DRN12_06820 [Thermoplasmata archaeon]|nr:MAG: hypothetical protein DRN12_06820 [Thermoplasmata archaeon]
MYKLFLTYFLAGILLLSIIPEYANSDIISNAITDSSSHTVLVEYIASPDCTDISDTLYEAIASGEYNFQYQTLLIDKYDYALNRSRELGASRYPAIYLDGGLYIYNRSI